MEIIEKLTIDIKALIEEIKQYEYMNSIYYTELEKSLTPFLLERAIFCLKNIASWFENHIDNVTNNTDYKKTIEVLSTAEKLKDEQHRVQRESEPLIKFWIAFNTWLDEESQDPASLYKPKYQEGYSDWGHWFTIGRVDWDKLYKSNYGKSYPNVTEDNISISDIKDLLEVFYREVVEPTKGRLSMTVKANDLFSRFKLPYKLQKGKLINIGYKTTFTVDSIENYEQFERKIEYAAEMIMHSDFTDKHCALKYIADAFCYLYSIYKKDSAKKIGELIANDNNSNMYKLVKDEVNLINGLINDSFDIRHNEENSASHNGQQKKREILNDPVFTEYLYNRINAFIMLIRIKRNQNNAKTSQISNIDNSNNIEDADDLPF